MILKKNGNIVKSVIFAGDYERITKNGLTRELYYIGGNAIAVKNDGISTLYYVHIDHLNSFAVITDVSGNIVQKCTYDAWGNREFVVKDTALVFDRGYTGHEHLDEFGLINMNGRMYDPIVGRFLSPDPYVQAPDFSQSFNRYTYALNNPLSYTDPTGEKLEWWQWTLGIADVLGGGALSATALLTAHNVSSLGIGLAGIASTVPVMPGFSESVNLHTIGTVAAVGIGNGIVNTILSAVGSIFNGNFGTRVGNAWRLSRGMFKTNENLNFAQRYWQFMSRYTYEMPVTAFGEAWNGLANAFSPGDVNVGYFHGATVLQAEWMSNGGITIGSNITIGYEDGSIDAGNPTLLHEYGHYLQTRRYGNMSWYNMAFSSITTQEEHLSTWTEQDANYRSMRYFQNKITPVQYNNFLTEPDFVGNFQSYYYRLMLGYLMPIEIFTDLLWR